LKFDFLVFRHLSFEIWFFSVQTSEFWNFLVFLDILRPEDYSSDSNDSGIEDSY
jgi:hypothetical protein